MATAFSQEDAEKDLNSGLPGLRLSSKMPWQQKLLTSVSLHLPSIKRQGHTLTSLFNRKKVSGQGKN